MPKSTQIQKQIVDILESIGGKIELNNKINAELEGMAKLIYEYWFVQFDFPFDFAQGKPADDSSAPKDVKPYKSSGGKMVWNKELKREIPEGWESGTADEIFDFNPTLSLKTGILAKYIDMNSIPQDGFMTLEPQIKEFTGGMKFQNNDVILARITPCLENGKTGLITQLTGDEIGYGSTEFIIIRGKKRQLSGFIAFLSRSEIFRKYAVANMIGTSGRKRVDAKTLKNFQLSIPSEELLMNFENLTTKLFKVQTKNIKENQELSSLRDWLLPMLMNGQVRVNSKEEKITNKL